MVNVTGVDGKGNELLSLIMSSFLLNHGTTLTKEKIEYYVEWALDATAYKEFRVVELDPSKRSKSLIMIRIRKRRNESLFYNRKRFCCPRFIRAY